MAVGWLVDCAWFAGWFDVRVALHRKLLAEDEAWVFLQEHPTQEC